MTISISAAALKKAKALAKKMGVSLNGFVCVALEEAIKKESDYQRARDRQIALMSTGF